MSLIQVVPSADAWAVLEDGNHRGLYRTQDEAKRVARSYAQEIGADFQLHGHDGAIQEKDNYGGDPPRNLG